MDGLVDRQQGRIVRLEVAPDLALMAMPMFFQIFTPIAPSSKERRKRLIVRSVNPGPSKPRASKVDAQARLPPPARCTSSVARSLSSRSKGSSPLAGQTTMSIPSQFIALIAARCVGACRWMWMWVSIRPKSGASDARVVASIDMAGIERRISLRVGIPSPDLHGNPIPIIAFGTWAEESGSTRISDLDQPDTESRITRRWEVSGRSDFAGRLVEISSRVLERRSRKSSDSLVKPPMRRGRNFGPAKPSDC